MTNIASRSGFRRPDRRSLCFPHAFMITLVSESRMDIHGPESAAGVLPVPEAAARRGAREAENALVTTRLPRPAEFFAATGAILIVSVAAFQLHFALPVTAFVF